MPTALDPPERQWFHFGRWTFDVTEAAAILARDPRPAGWLGVEPWARTYGLAAPPGVVALIRPEGLDREYALRTDLERPVLVATVTPAKAAPMPLLIDGIHRLYHAHVAGRERLPAWQLTQAETRRITRPRRR